MRLNRLYYKAILGKLGSNSNICPKVLITHPHNVFIQDYVWVNEFVVLQAHPKAPIRIGNGVRISYGAMIITTTLAIDTAAHEHMRDIGRNILPHEAEGVVIEDNAWIAAGAIVLPGVRVGTGSIVAAGAVVTHDVEPNTVVAGIPAKPIRNLKSKNNS